MTLFPFAMAATIMAFSPQAATDLGGVWEGRIDVQGQSVRIVLRVDTSGAEPRASLDSPDQGAFGIPVEGLASLEGGGVHFGAPTAGVRFEGRLGPDGRTLVGALMQGTSTPLVLTRTASSAAVSGPSRPQHPQAPFLYRAEDVRIPTSTAGVELAGTLTVPQGAGPFPAVVLITGSGGQDRDETVFGHKPFLVLADALTRQGVAVLRYDDRGIGQSSGDPSQATTADFAEDGRAAFAWLVDRPEIDAGRAGVLGHSEGGTIASLLARADDRVSFVVMLAGPAAPGADVLTEQSRQIQLASGIGAPVVDANTTVQARIMAAIAANAEDPVAASDAVRAVAAEFGLPRQVAEQAARQAENPWMRWFVAHDPRPDLSAMDVPLLALYGGKDVQVPAAQSAGIVRQLAPHAEVIVLPDLNHLMQTASSGLPAEYAGIEETINADALALIVRWIEGQTRAARED